MLDLKIINGDLVIPGTARCARESASRTGRSWPSAPRTRSATPTRTVDAAGKYVIPGVIDPHVHLGIFTGDFGYECETETRAALAGGVTTIGVFMGGGESYLPALPGLIETVNTSSSTDLFFHLSMFTPDQLAEIPQYIDEFGVTSFKFYMCGVTGVFPNVSDDFIHEGLKKLEALGGHLTGCVHCEDQDMVDEAVDALAAAKPDGGLLRMGRGRPGLRRGRRRDPGLPPVGRGRRTLLPRAPVVANGRRSRQGEPAADRVLETTSPYLSLTKNDEAGLLAKMLPPIKDDSDREALWEAVKDGTINTIGTDNVSLSREVKGADKGMLDAMPGYPVLQTHLPVLLTEGVNKRGVALETIVELTSRNPAEIFGVYPQKGTIAVGSDADLVVVDLDNEEVVSTENIYSFADFSLYEGRTLKGWPVMTIKDGVVAVEDGKISFGSAASGRRQLRAPGRK